ncbi:GNAT family N-acetyltransferase [Kitasatospora sp. NPDC101801]|uniref:GNAT family N-acetyltransferase n=1 Tax=Kitasatospora sp. NPDC101801 TaxID=3364103 RepID=UPI003821D5A0
MTNRGRLEQANDNAAAFWLAQARAHGWEFTVRPGFTAVRCARDAADTRRVVITRPYGPDGVEPLLAEVAELLKEWDGERYLLEDPYSGIDLTGEGLESIRAMAVMVREPDAPSVAERRPSERRDGAPGPVEEVSVAEVHGVEELAGLERVVVDGFPLEARQPWERGVQFPPELLAEPGYRAWLGRVDGEPAAACMTYDNEETVGVYWVAVLPEYRSKGLGRAVLSAALLAQPGRVTTLVATQLGEPLYRQLGFLEQGVTRWWR